MGQVRALQGVDYAAVFAAQPTAYLVMDPDLVIVEANEAYLQVLGRSRADLIGRPVFEVFPPPPGTLDELGRNPLQVSFERARDSGLPDQMPLFNYDVLDPVSGELQQRFWSLISSAVTGADGRAVLVLQRVEDVTDYVADRRAREAERDPGQAWERRVERVEADLYARAQELRAARDAEAQANRRLAALAEVALQLAQAQTVEELTDIIVERGLSALGADGGALAVSDGTGRLNVTVSSGLGEATQQVYGQVPADSSLPAAVTARTGKRTLLADRDESLASDPQMRQVLAETGCTAWAFVPLRLKEDLLGSLSVGWAVARTFTAPELGLLDVLAAQTSHGLARIQSQQAERAAALVAHRMSEALQRSLLTDPPRAADLEIAVRYRSAAEQAQVGGDWYDAFHTGDGALSVVIGDVAGHDRDAAAAMGQLRNLLRGVAHTSGERPAAALTALDRALRDLRVDVLATAVLATVGPGAGQDSGVAGPGERVLRWSNAGHPPPVLLDPDGAVRLLQTEPDLLLGLDPGTRRSDHEVVVPVGATVLLYTDGLVERRGAGIDPGLQWLLGAVQDWAAHTQIDQGRTGPAQQAAPRGDVEPPRRELDGPDPGRASLDALCDALLEQVADTAEDDVALLALRVLPPSSTWPNDISAGRGTALTAAIEGKGA